MMVDGRRERQQRPLTEFRKILGEILLLRIPVPRSRRLHAVVILPVFENVVDSLSLATARCRGLGVGTAASRPQAPIRPSLSSHGGDVVAAAASALRFAAVVPGAMVVIVVPAFLITAAAAADKEASGSSTSACSRC
jgi:hypothetical protein